jgi:hypothetical protein
MEAKFYIDVGGGATLSADEIWPEGNAPENPTVDDVVERIQSRWANNARGFIEDWNFASDMSVTVSRRSESKRAI